MFIRTLLCFVLMMPVVLFADEEHNHAGHSDRLLMLLQQKILIQKKQQAFDGINAELSSVQRADNLKWQGRTLKKTMPVLQEYMATPKSYYLTTEMYHESLENRAAMLADFSQILGVYYRQLSE